MTVDSTRQPSSRGATARLADGELRQVAGGSAITLLGSGVSAIAGLAILLLLARTVDQTVVGVFAATTSLALIIATVARLGTPTTVVYFVSRYRTLGPVEAIRPLAARMTVAVAAVSLALGIMLWAAAPALGGLVAGDLPQAATDSLRIVAVCLPAIALVEVAVAIAEAFRRMAPGSLADQTGRTLAQVILIALAAPTGNAVWLVAAWSLPYAPTLLILAQWDRRVLGRGIPAPDDGATGTAASPRELISFSTPRWLSSMVQISMQRMDIILVAILAGPIEAAIYTAASRVIVLAQVVQQSLGRVVQPRLSEALAAQDNHRAQALYLVSTSWLILLVWPVLLVLSYLSDQVMLLFSPDYQSGAPVIPILALTMLVATGSGVVDIVLVMSGRSARALMNTFIALLVMVVIDLWLVPQLGAIGAAWGWSTAILIRTALPLWQIHRDLGLHPLGRETVSAGAISLACFGLIPLAPALLLGPIGVWLGIALGAVAFVTVVWLRRDSLHLSDLLSASPAARSTQSHATPGEGSDR